MPNPFFEHQILTSPYACPRRHWELDDSGQPTQQIIQTRRRAEFITPIPKPKRRKAAIRQEEMVYDESVTASAEGIACWFIDTDYNEESSFVRPAYFLGANDPYSAPKITLKAEINEEAWATLHSDTSRAFEKPKSGRIAVKVINHLVAEVMKAFRVSWLS